MATRPQATVFLAAMIGASFLASTGCATTPEPEMIPVERVVIYSEKPDYRTAVPGAGFGSVIRATAAECREYRETLEKYEKIYLASVGVGVVSLVVGLLSDDEEVQNIAGVAAAGSTLAQAGTSTAHRAVAREAQERGCNVR